MDAYLFLCMPHIIETKQGENATHIVLTFNIKYI